MKCARLRGSQSRCPTCLSLEIGLLSLEVQNSSLEPLFLLLLILLFLLLLILFSMRCFQTLGSCLFIHKCIYTWYIWHLSCLTSVPNVCLNILAMIHLACTFIHFGAIGWMWLKVDSQLKHPRNRVEIVIPIFLFVTFLFPFCPFCSFLLPLCLHILELTPKYEKFKWSSMLAPSEQILAAQIERNPDISP